MEMVGGHDRVGKRAASMPAETTDGSVAPIAMDLEVLRGVGCSSDAGIYLDANSTVEPLPEVVASILSVFAAGAANAASSHARGSSARTLIQAACDEIAGIAAGLLPENIVFTSNGTEANMTSVRTHPANRARARIKPCCEQTFCAQ